jgi:hypothetical protein
MHEGEIHLRAGEFHLRAVEIRIRPRHEAPSWSRTDSWSRFHLVPLSNQEKSWQCGSTHRWHQFCLLQLETEPGLVTLGSKYTNEITLERSGSVNFSGGDIASLAENSNELLRCCLKSIHHLTWCYFYHKSVEESIPGSLPYLLSIREVDMVEIFKICDFCNEEKGAFLFWVFETWVAAASFDVRTVEVTTLCYPGSPHKKIPLIKISLGKQTQPPCISIKKPGPSSKILNAASRLILKTNQAKTAWCFCLTSDLKHRQLQLVVLRLWQPQYQVSWSNRATPSTTTTTELPTPHWECPPICQWKCLNGSKIASPGKAKLAMELIFEMDTPQKAPLIQRVCEGFYNIYRDS